MRRNYNGLDLYLDDELIAEKAQVVYDNARHTVVVSERNERRKWVETLRLEDVTAMSSEKVGTEMVYTWPGPDQTLTGVKAGCNCGGKR